MEKNELAVKKFESTMARMDEQIKLALPKCLSPERFARIVRTVVKKSPKLLNADVSSLLACVMTSAQQGLEPEVLGECYFVPYGNEVTYLIGYKGMLKLLRRGGEVQNLNAQVVYEKDSFEIDLGANNIIHKPFLDGSRGKPKYVYSVAEFKDGSKNIDFMNREDVEKRRAVAKTKNIWDKWESEMWIKTIIKHHCKRLPLSVETSSQLQQDEIVYRNVEIEKPLYEQSESVYDLDKREGDTAELLEQSQGNLLED